MISDVKIKALQIPAPDVGNIVGYEYEAEEQPLVLQRVGVSSTDPRRGKAASPCHFHPGWEYRALWLNYPEVKPIEAETTSGSGPSSDVKAIRKEAEMPPVQGVAGQMVVSFFPPGGAGAKGFSTWQQMGSWYLNLTNGRRDASPEIKQIVTTLTASATDASG